MYNQCFQSFLLESFEDNKKKIFISKIKRRNQQNFFLIRNRNKEK